MRRRRSVRGSTGLTLVDFGRFNGDAFAAFGTTAREDFATIGGLHASTKTVNAGASALFGLVGSFGSHKNGSTLGYLSGFGKVSPRKIPMVFDNLWINCWFFHGLSTCLTT